MFILEKPYVSKFLQETIVRNNWVVLKNDSLKDLNLDERINFLDESEFVNYFKKKKERILYNVSENSFPWIFTHLSYSELPRQIKLFKDKYEFRKKLSVKYPDFYFREIRFEELNDLDVSNIPKPFIIKPSLGFFSIAVYQVNTNDDWNKIKDEIKSVIRKNAGIFPKEVLDEKRFIIEECLEGDEFAVDAYFDKNGNAVIVNILKHVFSYEGDTRDRVYMTSSEIVKSTYNKIMGTLENISDVMDVKYFPIHMEVRINNKGNIGIIEANPLRFAGLCVTDIAFYAFGNNNYELFINQEKPDWDKILDRVDPKIKYAMVIGDFPPDIDLNTIISIDYEGYKNNFSKLIELRKVDYHSIPLFAISFVKFDDSNKNELEFALNNDFRDYINLKK